MRTAGLILAAGVVILSMGCAKKLDPLGKWVVAPEVKASKPAGLPEGFMMGFASTFYFTIKEDKTFEGAMSKGTYTMTGNNIVMSIGEVAGQTVPKGKAEMKGEFSEDGQSLTLHVPALKAYSAALQNVKMVKEKS